MGDQEILLSKEEANKMAERMKAAARMHNRKRTRARRAIEDINFAKELGFSFEESKHVLGISGRSR